MKKNVTGIITKSINLSGFSNISEVTENIDEVMKSDMEYAFAYAENIKFQKKGKEIKDLLSAKAVQCSSLMNVFANRMNTFAQILKEKGYEFHEDGYVKYDYEETSKDDRSIIDKYSDNRYKCKELKRDIEACNTLIENFDDNKSYPLTYKQLKTLSPSVLPYDINTSSEVASPTNEIKSSNDMMAINKSEEVEGLEKARKDGKVLVQKQITRGGRTFKMGVWMNPEDAKKESKRVGSKKDLLPSLKPSDDASPEDKAKYAKYEKIQQEAKARNKREGYNEKTGKVESKENKKEK